MIIKGDKWPLEFLGDGQTEGNALEEPTITHTCSTNHAMEDSLSMFRDGCVMAQGYGLDISS